MPHKQGLSAFLKIILDLARFSPLYWLKHSRTPRAGEPGPRRQNNERRITQTRHTEQRHGRTPPDHDGMWGRRPRFEN